VEYVRLVNSVVLLAQLCVLHVQQVRTNLQVAQQLVSHVWPECLVHNLAPLFVPHVNLAHLRQLQVPLFVRHVHQAHINLIQCQLFVPRVRSEHIVRVLQDLIPVPFVLMEVTLILWVIVNVLRVQPEVIALKGANFNVQSDNIPLLDHQIAPFVLQVQFRMPPNRHVDHVQLGNLLPLEVLFVHHVHLVIIRGLQVNLVVNLVHRGNM
jgi:hypothetical protein